MWGQKPRRNSTKTSRGVTKVRHYVSWSLPSCRKGLCMDSYPRVASWKPSTGPLRVLTESWEEPSVKKLGNGWKYLMEEECGCEDDLSWRRPGWVQAEGLYVNCETCNCFLALSSGCASLSAPGFLLGWDPGALPHPLQPSPPVPPLPLEGSPGMKPGLSLSTQNVSTWELAPGSKGFIQSSRLDPSLGGTRHVLHPPAFRLGTSLM